MQNSIESLAQDLLKLEDDVLNKSRQHKYLMMNTAAGTDLDEIASRIKQIWHRMVSNGTDNEGVREESSNAVVTGDTRTIDSVGSTTAGLGVVGTRIPTY